MPSRETVREAIGSFERAFALDPGSLEAQSLLAIAPVVPIRLAVSQSAPLRAA